MWQDRFSEREAPDIDLEEIRRNLDASDMELWRAKRRASDNRITAILDGIDICQEYGLALPTWLNEVTFRCYPALLGVPNAELNKNWHRYFLKEKTKLKRNLQAQLVHRIYRSHALQKKYNTETVSECGVVFEINELNLLRLDIPRRVATLANDHFIELHPSKMSQSHAAEIAALWLSGTWAEGEQSSILQMYKLVKPSLLTDLSGRELTDDQVKFLAYDLGQIRPNTLEAIGCPPIL